MAERPADEELATLEQGVRSLVFSREPALVPGLDEERQLLYRRMVRATLMQVVKNAAPRTSALLGDEAFRRLVGRWLEEAPPSTRILRHVPQELVAFCQALEDPPHPALGEVLHWDALEMEVTHAPDAEGPPPPATPHDDAGVLSHPSARLAVYLHPVHGLSKQPSAWPKPSKQPTFLVAYRAGERLHWVAVPRAVAQVLLHTGEGLTLGQAFATLDEQGAPVDRGFVRSWLVDLQRRGALLGFPRAGTEEASS